jgi:hypothetical protein
MTGLEKVGAMMLSAAGIGAAQPTLPGNLVSGANWPILVAVVAIAVAWGALTQRMAAVERRIVDMASTAEVKLLAENVEKLASKEAIESLDKKVDALVGMLNHRIADRRHHE